MHKTWNVLRAMLSILRLSVIMLSASIMSIILLTAIMLCANILCLIMLSSCMLRGNVLTVMVPSVFVGALNTSSSCLNEERNSEEEVFTNI